MRKMKNSGIEWIGEIPVGWEIVRIGTQYTERKKKVSDTEYPPLSVTMKGIVPQLTTAAKTDAHDDRKLVCIGDFAINSRSDRRGSCGISAYNGSVSLINTILCPRDKMNPNYYGWLFRSTMFSDEFYKWGHGIVNDLWTTNWQDMKKIFIPEPSLVEQQKIASFLDQKCAEIDAVIEKTKATIEEYKKLKQSVITEAVTKGIRGNRPMKDSGIEWIGEIPVGWDIIPLQYFADLNKETLGENTSPEYEFDYVEIGAVTLEKGIGEYQHYKFSDAPSRARRVVNVNDIIISTVRTYLKAIAIVPYKENLIVSTGFAVLTPKNIHTEYLGWSLKSNYFVNMVSSNSVGISYPAINASNLIKFKITIPSTDEQKEIADYLDQKCAEIDTLITKKTNLLTELETYKKSLIYEYVTGKKEVK